jgi:hypothetical protein
LHRKSDGTPALAIEGGEVSGDIPLLAAGWFIQAKCFVASICKTKTKGNTFKR